MRLAPIGHAGCSCFVAAHKTTPHAKCKAYKGQNVMRWQAESVRRNMGNFSLRLQLSRDARAKRKPPTSTRGDGFPA
jgi:hypothetical protein